MHRNCRLSKESKFDKHDNVWLEVYNEHTTKVVGGDLELTDRHDLAGLKAKFCTQHPALADVTDVTKAVDYVNCATSTEKCLWGGLQNRTDGLTGAQVEDTVRTVYCAPVRYVYDTRACTYEPMP